MVRLFVIAVSAICAFSSAVACTASHEGRLPAIGLGFDCGPDGEDQALLLSGFDLRFIGEDHKPQVVAVAHPTPRLQAVLSGSPADNFDISRRRTDTLLIALSDPDGRDTIRGVVETLPVHSDGPTTLLEVSRQDCSGRCILPVSQPWTADETPVLRGFAFVRRPNFDDNIRTIAVEPECTAIGRSCHFRVQYTDNDSREVYAALVQYSILPNDSVIARATHIGTFDSGDEARDSRVAPLFLDTPRAQHALGGFRFEFTEGDRFLGRIAASPTVPANEIEIVFRDGDDDGARPAVEYRVDSLGLDPSLARR